MGNFSLPNLMISILLKIISPYYISGHDIMYNNTHM